LSISKKEEEKLENASRCPWWYQTASQVAERAAADEVAELRRELASLRKQVSSASSRPGPGEGEGGLARGRGEAEAKMQDLESKLKSTLQDKVALQVSAGMHAPHAAAAVLWTDH